MSLEDADGKMPGNLDAAADSALDTVGVPDVDNSKKGNPDSASKGKTPGTEAVQGEEAESEATDDAQSANAGQNAAEGQQGAGQSKQGQQQAGSQSPGTAGDKSSLMSKLRDAMQNLLSRMKPQPSGAGGQQQASTSQNGREGRQQRKR